MNNLLRSFSILACFSSKGLVHAADAPVAATVEATLASSKQHIRQFAFDADPKSYFATAENAGKNDHFTLRLEKPVALKTLEIATGKENGDDALDAGDLQISEDGEKFETLAPFAKGTAKSTMADKKVLAVRVQPTKDLTHPLVIREVKLDSTPPVAAFKYPLEIVVAANDSPELKAWLEKVIRICERSYPMLNEELSSDGYRPPFLVSISLKDSYQGVAAASGDRITGSVKYFKDHQNDVGAMVHEMAHVVQQYRGRGNPGWLVEGVADYVRYYKFEPGKGRRVNPNSAKYDGSYGTTAAFLAYVTEKYDKEVVRKLNQAMRDGKYKETLFKDYTGKTVQELGAEWKESLAGGK